MTHIYIYNSFFASTYKKLYIRYLINRNYLHSTVSSKTVYYFIIYFFIFTNFYIIINFNL